MTEEKIFSGKTLLILNTCNIKKEFIWQKIRNFGLTTIVVNEEKNWAAPYVDHWIVIDTSKHEEVIKCIEKFIKEHQDLKIDGVLTFCEDTVLLTSKVVDHFGFIGIPFTTSKNIRNKYLFREFCEKNGIQVPQHSLVHSLKDINWVSNNFKFPVVIKPVFGSGSSYVIKAENKKTLEDIYDYLQKSISIDKETALHDGTDIMVEEYITGTEVDIDILVQDKKIKFISITDNLPTHEPYFVEAGENCPSQLSVNKQEELKDMAKKIVQQANFKNACFHLEAKSTNNGAVPIELNLRMGGGDVVVYMEKVWGVDFVEYSIRIALGIPFDDIIMPKPLKYMMAETIMIDKPGVVIELRCDDELKKKSYVEKFYLAKKIGDRVDVPPASYDYLGWITISGASYNEAKKNLAEAKKLIHFEIQPTDK